MAANNSSNNSSNKTKEYRACGSEELRKGAMMEANLGDAKVLLIRTSDGNYYASGNKCTHYGASLVKGVLCGTRVTCPWHGSCFDVKTGDIEEAPAFDALMTFPVRVDGNDVFITLPDPIPKNWRREIVMAEPASDSDNQKTVLLIGGGPANLACAEKLRQLGFAGKIILVTGEIHYPYDRPKLSKALSSKPEAIVLRPPEFYASNNIEILLGNRVKEFDPVDNFVLLDDDKNTRIDFNIAVIATGGDARLIKCEGDDLQGIYPLRNPEDSLSVNADGDNCKAAVVIGSSFIGMEVAACLKQAKKISKVTVVGMEKVAFERVLGEPVGQALQNIHVTKGVDFRMGVTVSKFEGNKNGRVSAVILSNGEKLPCDLVVIGAGVIPATNFLKNSNSNNNNNNNNNNKSSAVLKLDRDGSVICDKYLHAEGFNHIFAAGDVAKFPCHFGHYELTRIEHWDVAIQHGRVIAQSIFSGKPVEYLSVPFFWTQSFGVTVRYAGLGHGWDDMILKGNIFENKFAVFYTRKEEVIAVAALNVDPLASTFSELLRTGKVPSKTQLQSLTLEELNSNL